MFNGTNFISAILLTSRNIDRLATFYKDVLKVPLEDEQHGKSDIRFFSVSL